METVPPLSRTGPRAAGGADAPHGDDGGAHRGGSEQTRGFTGPEKRRRRGNHQGRRENSGPAPFG